MTTSIRAILGADATDDKVKGVIDQLIERGIVAITGGKVTYPSL